MSFAKYSMASELKNHSRMFNAFFGFVLFFISLIFLLFITSIISGCSTYSSGYRDGNLQKVTKKRGWIYSCYEGELALPGLVHAIDATKKGQPGGSVWAFNLNQDLVNKLENVSVDQTIRLYYDESWSWKNWNQSTNYMVHSFKIRDGDEWRVP